MNKFSTTAYALFLSIFFTDSLQAQELSYCGTTEMVQKSLDANPELKKDFMERRSKLEQMDKQAYANGYSGNSSKAMGPVYIIPIVFHILHQNGIENISDEQIYDEVRILNEDFRKLNPDTSGVVSAFKSRVADCEIEFRLAQKDPNGACTNGIDRIYTPLTNNAGDNSKINSWPRSQYLNVWVVKTIGMSGVAGYAYLPGTAPSAATDGIIILSSYVGSIGSGEPGTSRALTHEIGHFLDLMHLWGYTNDPGVSCGDDGVSDTPQTKGWTVCNTSGATCGNVIDNVQNFMEYSYCCKMFTTGQKNAMRNALIASAGQRNTLWTTSNLTATGVSLPAVLCKADFKSNNPASTICQGDSLTFTDLSWNGNATSWNWTFPGGTPATSTDSMPKVRYNTAGIYNVSLTVTNSSGSVSTTKNNYVTVNPSTALYSVPFYSESFENAAIPNADWQVRSSSTGSNTWSQTNAAAATGTKSARILNGASVNGFVYELIGPTINMTALAGTGIYLKFKVAYAKRNSTSDDKLAVYVSLDCGKTWNLRKSLQASAMATGGVLSASFVPNANQWLQQNVVMSGYVNETNLMFMFRFTSGGGNNIYIDDINLSSGAISMGIEDEITNNLHFNVYPNPVEENTVVAFNLIKKEKTEITICDVVGRTVTVIYNGELNAGEYEYLIMEKYKLNSGIYFVKLNVGEHSFTKKLVVN